MAAICKLAYNISTCLLSCHNKFFEADLAVLSICTCNCVVYLILLDCIGNETEETDYGTGGYTSIKCVRNKLVLINIYRKFLKIPPL